ncbi:hypothetical protein LINPERHAP1_LOCUS22018 [Linum perenne]
MWVVRWYMSYLLAH